MIDSNAYHVYKNTALVQDCKNKPLLPLRSRGCISIFRMGLKSHARICDRAAGSGEYKDLYRY